MTDCSAPCVRTVIGALTDATPEPSASSVHWKLTVTSAEFQPFAFGRVRDTESVGATMSVSYIAASVHWFTFAWIGPDALNGSLGPSAYASVLNALSAVAAPERHAAPASPPACCVIQ